MSTIIKDGVIMKLQCIRGQTLHCNVKIKYDYIGYLWTEVHLSLLIIIDSLNTDAYIFWCYHYYYYYCYYYY